MPIYEDRTSRHPQLGHQLKIAEVFKRENKKTRIRNQRNGAKVVACLWIIKQINRPGPHKSPRSHIKNNQL